MKIHGIEYSQEDLDRMAGDCVTRVGNTIEDVLGKIGHLGPAFTIRVARGILRVALVRTVPLCRGAKAS